MTRSIRNIVPVLLAAVSFVGVAGAQATKAMSITEMTNRDGVKFVGLRVLNVTKKPQSCQVFINALYDETPKVVKPRTYGPSGMEVDFNFLPGRMIVTSSRLRVAARNQATTAENWVPQTISESDFQDFDVFFAAPTARKLSILSDQFNRVSSAELRPGTYRATLTVVGVDCRREWLEIEVTYSGGNKLTGQITHTSD